MSIWQTLEWQQMLKKSRQVSDFFKVPISKSFPPREKDFLYIEKRKVALGEFGLFILGIGDELSEKDVKQLIELCKKENCLFIQLETLNYENNSKLNISNFKNGYYKKFITPYTSVIDLEKTEDEILAKMKPKGRYNIKVALKKGVEVKEVEKTEENIKKYYDLMLETTSRDGFNGNSMDYYKTFLKSLKNSKLLLAYVGDKVVAGGIFTFNKDVSIYYYGASTSDKEYRNIMAPYLLQWEAVKIAKEIDSKLYDFLGVATPGDTNSELAGVTDFKLKLSKDVRKVSESYIWINKSFKYNLILLLRYFKKLIKK